jgi:hypothetical protein
MEAGSKYWFDPYLRLPAQLVKNSVFELLSTPHEDNPVSADPATAAVVSFRNDRLFMISKYNSS